MVRVERQKNDEDFSKRMDNIIRKFAVLFREQGRAHESLHYLTALLIIKCLNDLHAERRSEPAFDPVAHVGSAFAFTNKQDKGDILFPIPYKASKIQLALSFLEEAFPNLLRGAFSRLDFDTLLPGTTKEKSEDFLETLKKLVSAVQFTFSPKPDETYSAAKELCRCVLSRFDSFAGKNMAIFYTPAEIAELMTQLVKPTRDDIFLDPACGTGEFLLSALGYAASQPCSPQKLIGLELDASARSLAQMSLFLCGEYTASIFHGSLISEAPLPSDIKMGKIDVIVSNPPFSQQMPLGVEETLKRNGLLEYGVPPSGNADFAYIQVMLAMLNPEHGRMAVVTSMGALFRRGAEKEIRRKFLDECLIEAVILLPERLFYNTSISVSLVIFRRNRKDKNVLFINAVKKFHQIKKINILSSEHIKYIVAIYLNKQNINGFARVVDLSEIAENEYDLLPSRYVDSAKDPEELPILADLLRRKADTLATAADVEKSIEQSLTILEYV
jgi:type I restriction enzyme M protein